VTTSSSSQIPLAPQHLGQKSVYKSIRPRSHATCAPKNLLEPTTSVPISVPTQTNVPSCAPSARKPLLASTTARGTKAYTAARRNLYAAASSGQEAVGVVGGGLLEQMLSAGISEAKPDASVSSLYLTKKPWIANALTNG